MATMSADDAKRNVNNDGFTSEDLRGDSGSPAAKRLKTDAMATDPTSEVVLNPDILSKVLLCIDMSEVPSVAQTCKVWKHTLGSIEQTLWKGLVEKHCPPLKRVTDMLPDSVGVEEPRNSADGIPAPSKNWRCQFKRRVLVRRCEAKKAKAQALESYLFEIRCRSFRARERQETITFIEAADCAHQYTNGDWTLMVRGFPLPENISEDDALVSVYVHNKSTGREALLYDGPTEGHVYRLNKIFEVLAYERDDDELDLDATHQAVLRLGLFVVDNIEPCSPEDCLAILARWLDWK